MLLVVTVIFTAAVVEVSKETDDGDITFRCGQKQAIALDTLPMRDAMQLS